MSHIETLLVTFAAIVAIVIVRVWRMTREQRFGIYTMWFVPLIFSGLIAFIMVVDRVTTPIQLALSVIALASGAGLGLTKARTRPSASTARRVLYS